MENENNKINEIIEKLRNESIDLNNEVNFPSGVDRGFTFYTIAIQTAKEKLKASLKNPFPEIMEQMMVVVFYNNIIADNITLANRAKAGS